MKLFDTLSGNKSEFIPIDPDKVKIYSCGPTVYSYAHLGNMRAYIFTDTLRRVLERDGYNVFQVMNITDVGHLVSDADEGEDKVVKAAQSMGKTPLEITECYTEAFFHDTRLLNIRTPNLIAKATEHIADMLECIEKLVDLGYGYETSDGIYYDISKFPDYGKLSRLDLEGQIAGARVEVNEEKRNPADFILWVKAPKEHIMQWPSKWGMGYPGWHIECTAMSRKYLGEIMDIHTGGVDHIPVHHENEIAQSEALSGGKKTVNYWMHNEFIMVDNGKMSKSLGTSYTLADFIERGFDPLVFRYFCLNGHYKSKLNFTWDGMKAVRTSYERFLETALSHSGQTGIVDAETLETLKSEFYEAVGDDLNIPKALGVAWNMLRLPVKSGEIFEAIVEMDAILGLDISRAADKLAEMNRANAPETDAEILGLVEQRQQARKEKNWKLADEIRDKLKQMNIILEDTPEGIKYRKADNI